MKRIFLHIGYPKTGSSALQTSLLASRTPLLEHGYFFPDAPSGLCNAFASRFHPQPQTLFPYCEMSMEPKEIAKAMVQDFERFATDLEQSVCEAAIISSESLIAVDDYGGVQRVYDWLAPRAEQILIVCYVRDPRAFAASVIQERVKWGGRIPSIDASVPVTDIAGGDLLTGMFSATLPLWSSVFGRENVVVRSASRQDLTAGDIVTDFAALVGYTGPWDRHNEYENKSLSHTAVLLLDALNGLDERLGRDTPEFRTLWNIPGGKYQLAPALMEQVKAKSKCHTDYLRDEWGICFADRDDYEAPMAAFDEEAASFLSEWMKDMYLRAN